jgi:hypothetical protein
MCGLPVPDRHRHILDVRRRELLCACRPCSILFDRPAAGGGHYALVPDGCTDLGPRVPDEPSWNSLGLPVQMAFLVRDGDSGRVRAFYPSPAGATESTVELETWADIEARAPALGSMQPDVEALLIDRIGLIPRAFIVGIDECYRLVGLVRLHWTGFGGGDRVWLEIDRFFSELARRARERQ